MSNTRVDGSVIIAIDADSKGFEDSLKDLGKSAEKQLGPVEKSAEEAAKEVEGLGDAASKADDATGKLASGGLKALAAGAAATAAAVGATVAAVTDIGTATESAFAQTKTIMDSAVVSYDDMREAVTDLSVDVGEAATTLYGSVYDAISSTGDTANAVLLVEKSSKLATAGYAEQGDALSTLTTIMNAYKLELTDAEHISDTLITTQNLGVTTVAQLAAAMGKAIATASAYSIDLYNLESAYISLTKAGISTEESTTYVSSMFNELGSAGSEVAAILKEETGKSFGELMKSGATLGDVLGILNDSVDGNGEALMNLWGSAEAGKAALAIVGQDLQTFNDNVETLKTSVGTTEAAYQTMANTVEFQSSRVKTALEALGTTIYDKSAANAPAALERIADAISDLRSEIEDGELSDEFEEFSEAIADLIESGADLVEDVLPALVELLAWLINNGKPVATVVGAIAAALGVYKAQAALAAARQNQLNLTLLANPYNAVAAALAALTVAVVAYSGEMDGLSSEVRDLTDEVAESAEAFAAEEQSIIDDAEAARALVADLEELSKKENKTAEDMELMRSKTEALNKLMPDLGLAFDDTTGSLSDTTTAIYDYIDAVESAARATAVQDRLVELQSQVLELEQQRREAEAEYNRLMAEAYAQAADPYTASSAVGWNIARAERDIAAIDEALESVNAEVDSLSSEAARLSETLVETGEAGEDAGDGVDTAGEAVETLGEISDDTARKIQDMQGWLSTIPNVARLCGTSVAELAADLVDAGYTMESLSSAAEAMRDSVVNAFQKIAVDEETTAFAIAENLAENQRIHSEWASNLAKIWANAQSDTVRAFVLYMYDQGPEYAQAVAQFAEGGTHALVAAAESFSQIGDDTAASYLTRVAGQESLADAADAGDDLTGTILGQLEAAETDYETVGTESGEAYADALTDAIDGVDWEGEGYNAAARIATGIESGSILITKAVQRVIANTAVDDADVSSSAASTAITAAAASTAAARVYSSSGTTGTTSGNQTSSAILSRLDSLIAVTQEGKNITLDGRKISKSTTNYSNSDSRRGATK